MNMNLFTQFSVVEIVTFVVMTAAAIKGFVSFFEWGTERITKVVHHEDSQKELKDSVKELQEKVDTLEETITLLRKSDICAFKSYIAKEYNQFQKAGYIDVYSLEAIEERYKIYKEEGGNSFVGQLISAIRELPKEAPKE
jgi:enoyl-[acyl-carrier-protein] reductase (NADH)